MDNLCKFAILRCVHRNMRNKEFRKKFAEFQRSQPIYFQLFSFLSNAKRFASLEWCRRSSAMKILWQIGMPPKSGHDFGLSFLSPVFSAPLVSTVAKKTTRQTDYDRLRGKFTVSEQHTHFVRLILSSKPVFFFYLQHKYST